jgi:hypothetical protein
MKWDDSREVASTHLYHEREWRGSRVCPTTAVRNSYPPGSRGQKSRQPPVADRLGALLRTMADLVLHSATTLE